MIVRSVSYRHAVCTKQYKKSIVRSKAMMDGNDNDNNNDDENHQGQQQQVVDIDDDDENNEEEGDVAADTMLVRANRRAKLLSLLDQYNACPFRTRHNIDELVAEVLEKAENDVHEMLCDQNLEDYQGLDINRDTVEEVRTILQIFPNTLSKRKETKWAGNDDEDGVARGWINAEDGEGEYPIQCVLDLYGPNGCRFNFKATSFVAVLAQVATELDQFEEEERGGLLIKDEYGTNTLQFLLLNFHSSDEGELTQRVDIVCRTQFIQLQRMGLFKQEDIPRYELVHILCYEDYFSERRFQFLVEWDPSSLVDTNEVGCLPLHCAAQKSTIQGFRIVLEYLIRYYPTKKGISSLFIKNDQGETAFQIACIMYGKVGVTRILEDTLNSSVIPLNIVEAVVMAAADENLHLE